MWRAWVVVGLLAAALVPAPAASAHICAIPAHFTLNQRVILNVAVPAEDKPITAVDISIPDGFVLRDAAGFLGFQTTRHAHSVHFEGGNIGIYDCQSFSLEGTPTRAGKLVAHIVTTADDGTKTHYDSLRAGSQYPAQVIYVAGKTAAPTHHFGVSTRTKELLLVALFGIGVAVIARRQGRAPHEPV